MSLKLFPKLFFHYFSPTIFRQSFSTQRLLPKSSILSAHSIKVKNDALLKSIRIFENKKPHVKSKYVAEVEEIVKGLQPRGFLAPLNPCPVYNEKFGQKRKIRSIRKLKIPEIYLGDRIQSWVHSIDLTENAVQKSGLIELDRDVFGQCLRTDILHRVVLYQMARKRAGTAKQKSKAEVRGGGRKPWHQKGTGRARHGSIRSPLFSGGGRSFPKRPRDFSFGLQKKVKFIIFGVCVCLILLAKFTDFYLISAVYALFLIFRLNSIYSSAFKCI